jgi:rhodanese-related sulfurtransferase
VALRLIEKGFTKVSVLEGGWDAWVQAGNPTVPK